MSILSLKEISLMLRELMKRFLAEFQIEQARYGDDGASVGEFVMNRERLNELLRQTPNLPLDQETLS